MDFGLIYEALGVPDNIIQSAELLYKKIYSTLRGYEYSDEIQRTYRGDFTISDYKLVKIIFDIKFHRFEDEDFDIMGLGQVSKAKLTQDLRYSTINDGFSQKIRLDLITPMEFTTDELLDYFEKNKVTLVSYLAHELKHGYDQFKKPEETIKSRIEYDIYANKRMGKIIPLNRFLKNSYYIHNVENLVRPTEMAAEIVQLKITPQEFYKYFTESKIFQTLKEITEFSIESLKTELRIYEEEMDEIFTVVGEKYSTLDEKISRMIELFYINLSNWKLTDYKNTLFPMGYDHPMYELMVDPKREEFLKNYINDIHRYAKNMEKFFVDEQEFQVREAKKMLRKLGRLYELTYQNIVKENKSIHNWEMYHKIKGTDSPITNKLIFEDSKWNQYVNLFDGEMSYLENLNSSDREYWDSDTDEVYDRKNYYFDVPEDWEDNWWIFSLGNENQNNEYELFYNKEILLDEISKFPPSKFGKLLSNWFTKNYGYKLYKLVPK